MSEAEERREKLARMKALAEKAYDDMYEAHSFGDANECYSNAKESFYDAIGLAGELGLKDESEALRKRLGHIKEVFRSQFAR
jgi:hypothetical protein